MVLLPPALLHSLEHVKGFNEDAFVKVHAGSEQVTSIRLNPAKQAGSKPDFSQMAPDTLPVTTSVPWSTDGYYLAKRPSFTFDPLFHAGTYYVQEASSMFLEQVLRQTTDLSQPLRVLDLCAAPGGKSTLLQSLLSKEGLLVSNEVIKSRAAVLEENITKWGAGNVVVTCNDPGHFARLENYFDIIVVDAPCSGSGLFRRDPAAVEEWSENNVQLCSQRQQRILADVWPALKQDGLLIYATCSYSVAEDETILDWLCETFSVKTARLDVKETWQIVETLSGQHGAYGYRFYPDKVKGEGFFIAALRKQDGGAFAGIKASRSSLEKISKMEETIARNWLTDDEPVIFFKQKDDIIVLQLSLQNEIPILQSSLYIKKAGITVGKLAGNELIPHHALALSPLINKNIADIELNRQQAIQYLRREDFPLDSTLRGWCLVTYQQHNLGWIKILPNRFNNYYPKEWRILKQPPESA